MRRLPSPLEHRLGTSPSGKDRSLCEKRLDERRLLPQNLLTERLDVKVDSGSHIRHGLFVRVTFADNDPLQPERVGDGPVHVLFE